MNSSTDTDNGFCYDPEKVDQIIRLYRTSDSAQERDDLKQELLEETLHNRTVTVEGKSFSELTDTDLIQRYLQSDSENHLHQRARIDQALLDRGFDVLAIKSLPDEVVTEKLEAGELEWLKF